MSQYNIQRALDEVDMTYAQLIEIANDILENVAGDVNALVGEVQERAEDLSNEDIRAYMVKLALKSYSFSEIKEKAAFKATLAETIRKNAYAKKFGELEGSVAAKESQAVLRTSEEFLTEALYELVASLFKTKLDEAHRVVDVLKTTIMSRLQEAKLTQIEEV